MQQPVTRDMAEVAAALASVERALEGLMGSLPHPESSKIAEQELRFQADRLAKSVQPDTPDEGGHLSDLRYGYEEAADALECLRKLRGAARYVGILRRYQQGRLARMGTEKPSGPSMDEHGNAVAFTEE